jgi:non-canonical purine NTP pyrophosphatase (RdgB/HAM1 family)
MKRPVFITGNAGKAKYLAKYLGVELEHVKLDLEEIQTLDLKEVVHHKVREAYKQINKPVLVEDVSLEFSNLGKLPGPLIRLFLEELSSEHLCRLADGGDRRAIGRCMFGYFDGKEEHYIAGELHGTITDKPSGGNGFGWDCIFIPDGFEVTRAELNETDYEKVYRKIRPIDKLRELIET